MNRETFRISSQKLRGCSTPTPAPPVGASPSSRAPCAMAARCLCSATASRTPSRPSNAPPATRTACSLAPAAPRRTACTQRTQSTTHNPQTTPL
ncbi:hypothetical protein ANANG_G00098360 [Anguilla anguilla]|uniref:Uncharacterized protein n=1 Tax=Anguilla anguilla TaxID=7936 RepID=A0A9D3RYG1_ANGAN|nr:hypothetical protein ANANG_G00098360 [Anguilla anguilla]